ncbi:DNA polymerase ligase N-terminal domain-containing protein [Frigoriglobus tundricola]|uniref:DNA polymerase ligase N-terminal domain-containing protein n=1 Tax=Frigoriglobus tundricola TaxID=2774151 RepID=UPI00148EB170|nr:DNA polymerase ligase N-terminal domain-containing protein [Frigoriglobus tundricola]
MPRFVILTHDWPHPHWDFLAEAGGVLRAWRLLAEPVVGADVPAEPNVPHRLFYLDYEGPVSGGRGRVTRWDAGTCDWLADDPGRADLHLRGAKVAGRATIGRVGAGWVFHLRASRPGWSPEG